MHYCFAPRKSEISLINVVAIMVVWESNDAFTIVFHLIMFYVTIATVSVVSMELL